MPDVTAEALSVAYGEVNAVKDVAVRFADAETTVLLGPSGSGKSTLLMAMAGLAAPSSGRIRIGDRTVYDAEQGVHVAPEDRRLGVVFQAHALWPHMTVETNVGFPLRHGGRRIDASERRARVARVLELVGLEGYNKRYPGELSGGQSQRVSLARALVYEPVVLLLDEPLSALDAVVRQQMRREIAAIQRELRTTMVYVTHDRDDAEQLADELVIMRDGRVVEAGRAETLFQAPKERFTAEFLLDAIVVEGRLTDNHLLLEHPARRVPFVGSRRRPDLEGYEGRIGFAHSALTLEPSDSGDGVVEERHLSAGLYRYRVSLGNGTPWEPVSHDRFDVGARVSVGVRHDMLFPVSGGNG